MTASAPDPLTRQQLINLLSQHKQGVPVQELVGLRVDVVTRWPGMNPALQREIERDAVSI
jgi:hypothetical protein